MAFTFEVHKDGASRTRVLLREYSQRWYGLKKELENFTCNGVPLTISLNSLGELVVCAPNDALSTFCGSGLEYLTAEDIFVVQDGCD